jgi:DNA transformation protein and related proteins
MVGIVGPPDAGATLRLRRLCTMARDALVDHCLELLAPLGAARARRMFGSHGLYVDDVFVALVHDQTLWLKTDAASRPRFEAEGGRPFSFVQRGETIETSYYSVPAEALESPALMLPWARLALQAALAARSAKKKPARKRGG